MAEKCPTCGSDSADKKLVAVLDKYKIPFRCKSCGSLDFPYRATLDRVMVFPDPLPETFLQEGSLIIPHRVQYAYEKDYGVVVAVGPGYFNKRGKFTPTTVKPGDRVCYDKNRPSQLNVPCNDGQSYSIKLVSEQDIHGTVEEDD